MHHRKELLMSPVLKQHQPDTDWSVHVPRLYMPHQSESRWNITHIMRHKCSDWKELYQIKQCIRTTHIDTADHSNWYCDYFAV